MYETSALGATPLFQGARPAISQLAYWDLLRRFFNRELVGSRKMMAANKMRGERSV
jgi:hypothetical protein